MWRRAAIVLGALGTVGVLAACGADRDATRASAEAASSSAVVSEPGSADAAAAPDAQTVATAVPPVSGPRIVQAASLSVSVTSGTFEDAFAEARTIAAGAGGYVTSSTSSQGPGERLVRGTLVVRVPADSYGRTLSSLSRLGRVEAREEAGEDVTGTFVDLEARERHLTAVETQLLSFLARTETVDEALAVQSRLADVQLALEEVQGQLRSLRDRTSLATITLSLAERGVPAATPGGGGIGDAWATAVDWLGRAAAAFVVVSVAAAPFVLVLGASLVGWRLVRRRRSRAVDPVAPTATPPA